MLFGLLEAPQSTTVQTLLLPKSQFTPSSAKTWARKHGYRASKAHPSPTGKFIRVRQRPPSDFKKGSLRTVHFGHGIEATVGHLREDMKRKKNPKGNSALLWVAGGAVAATAAYFIWKANQAPAPQPGLVVSPQGANVTVNPAQAVQQCLQLQKAGIIPSTVNCNQLATGT